MATENCTLVRTFVRTLCALQPPRARLDPTLDPTIYRIMAHRLYLADGRQGKEHGRGRWSLRKKSTWGVVCSDWRLFGQKWAYSYKETNETFDAHRPSSGNRVELPTQFAPLCILTDLCSTRH